MAAHEWEGRALGSRRMRYGADDVISYALAVGADPAQLDLVLERELRVLPTFALTLGQWAPDVLGSAGVFDVGRALHGSHRLTLHGELPPEGEFDLEGEVLHVWDKGTAAVFEIAVRCRWFESVYSVFAPGAGGFGGDRGPRAEDSGPGPEFLHTSVPTHRWQPALYRLSGDRHLIHIDPEAARRIGQPAPIMHGLCTLATAALGLAGAANVHPCDLRHLEARFSAPVLPGRTLHVSATGEGPANLGFEVAVDGQPVIDRGRARFAAPGSNSSPSIDNQALAW
ncbi:MAG: MaoC/PaaZ C-terminal domain-containing protein [Actinomycetota bacterium]